MAVVAFAAFIKKIIDIANQDVRYSADTVKKVFTDLPPEIERADRHKAKQDPQPDGSV